MKTKFYILTYLILFFVGCKSNKTDLVKDNKSDTKTSAKTVSENEKWTPITFFITDTSKSKYPFVKLTTIDKEGTYQIEWGNKIVSWSENLMTLTNNQGYRMPPTVLWHNDNFICLMTNHTGSYSQHLFLPLKEQLKPIFFEDDIEYTDSTDNFVCCIKFPPNSAEGNVTWIIQNLLTGKSTTFQIRIGKNSVCYPWYHEIYRKGDFLIIEYSQNSVKKINIRNYCKA